MSVYSEKLCSDIAQLVALQQLRAIPGSNLPAQSILICPDSKFGIRRSVVFFFLNSTPNSNDRSFQVDWTAWKGDKIPLIGVINTAGRGIPNGLFSPGFNAEIQQ
jgi:hypothetical protein